MNNQEAGFDQFLNRGVEAPKEEWSEDEIATRMSRFSGSGIGAGLSKSSDGRLQVSWDDAFINVSDGARNRVLFGNLEKTGDFGIRFVDKRGNIRFESSDALEQLSMYDEDYNKLIQIDDDGFHAYDEDENEVTKVDADGFHAYDVLNNELIKIDAEGFHGLDTSANELVKVDSEGFHGYKTGGVKQLKISGDGVEGYGTLGNTFKFYDEEGGTLYGQMGYLTSNNSFYFLARNGAKLWFTSNSNINFYGTEAADVNVTALGTGDVNLVTASGDINLAPTGGINVNLMPGVSDVAVWTDALGVAHVLTFTKGIITGYSAL